MGLKDLKNRLDFYLREKLRFSRPFPVGFSLPPNETGLHVEFRAFLTLFTLSKLLSRFSSQQIEVADVGARNFSWAPVIDEVLRSHGKLPTVHGIEVDAFRVLSGFHSRNDFGRFYANSIPHGEFHAMDFLAWERPLDLIFLLNPFVTPTPLRNWGLPKTLLKPEELFQHAFTILKPNKGILIVSAPSAEELGICTTLAEKTGFERGQSVQWTPPIGAIQEQERLGVLFAVPFEI